MAILGIDHVGIAVRDGDSVVAAETFSRLLGAAATGTETVESQGVRVCFVPASAPNLELLSPTTAAGSVARFLEKRGEGMHHVCFAVDDIRAELARLAAEGFKLIDRVPRVGHAGLVAFIHPRSACGVLIELLERIE